MAGDYITCPDCRGWPSCETGMLCLTCGDDGVVWDEYPDEDPFDPEGEMPSELQEEAELLTDWNKK